MVQLCCHVEGHQNLRDAGATPLGTGAWLTPRNTLLPHVCYHTAVRRCMANIFGVIMEIRQKIFISFVPPFKPL